MLSLRSASILKTIVGHYIARATPVSSQTVTEVCALGVSPATIRNEMAHLEDEGFITRCHPSAGSVPSDKGYRYYVESLEKVSLPPSEQFLISHLLHQVDRETEKWLSLAATLIARSSQNVAIVTTPRPAHCKLKHLELVSLQDSLALLVLVFHGARVRQQLMTFDQALPQEELTATANKLNAVYSGLCRSEISGKATETLSAAEQQVADCVLKLMHLEDEQEHEETYLDGLHFMFSQPEFARSQQFTALMELLDQRRLLNVLSDRLAGYGVHVIIGKENTSEAIQSCSVVIGRYGIPDEAIGTVSVVGPTRMPYPRIISTINYLSSLLSMMVAELYGRKAASESMMHGARS
ncbi:MAG: heat-inducible transcription repressor HrcA [Chloroflexi bacterium]|nr:heat-inducible transcription repressor HrcA [Chloroflexota bacterium]